jgi:hypothetical protein
MSLTVSLQKKTAASESGLPVDRRQTNQDIAQVLLFGAFPLRRKVVGGMSGNGLGFTEEKPMSWIFSAVLALAAPTSSNLGDRVQPPPNVEIEVELLEEQRIRVRFVNLGKESLTVLTRGFTFRGVEEKVFNWEVVFGLPNVTRNKDRVVVPAIDNYGPVKLMPGEVTEPIIIHLDQLYKAVSNNLVPWGETRVVYEVHPFWGKRFGLADGKVAKKLQGVMPSR